jgi:hypothetical protein
LIAYVVALALLAILGIALWNRLPAAVTEPAPKGAWSLASRSAPGFAISQHDSNGKTETYEIFRHSLGRRKDVFRWTDADRRPMAELEIYRPGAELKQAGPPRGWTRSGRANWKPSV